MHDNGQKENKLIAVDSVAIKAAIREGYTKRIVKLRNGLGTVSIYLPAELDTFYIHRHSNDTPESDGPVYRFSSKRYGVYKDSVENWFIRTEHPDSLYQFEIIQNDYPNIYGSDISMTKALNGGLKEEIRLERGIKALEIKDTLINQREYVMYRKRLHEFYFRDTIKHDTAGFYNMNIDATTLINGYGISLSFQCYGKNFKNFFDKMDVSLRTLIITPDSTIKKYSAKDVDCLMFSLDCARNNHTKTIYKLNRDSLFMDTDGNYEHDLMREGKEVAFKGIPLRRDAHALAIILKDSIPDFLLNFNTDHFTFSCLCNVSCTTSFQIKMGDKIKKFFIDIQDTTRIPKKLLSYVNIIKRVKEKLE